MTDNYCEIIFLDINTLGLPWGHVRHCRCPHHEEPQLASHKSIAACGHVTPGTTTHEHGSHLYICHYVLIRHVWFFIIMFNLTYAWFYVIMKHPLVYEKGGLTNSTMENNTDTTHTSVTLYTQSLRQNDANFYPSLTPTVTWLIRDK